MPCTLMYNLFIISKLTMEEVLAFSVSPVVGVTRDTSMSILDVPPISFSFPTLPSSCNPRKALFSPFSFTFQSTTLPTSPTFHPLSSHPFHLLSPPLRFPYFPVSAQAFHFPSQFLLFPTSSPLVILPSPALLPPYRYRSEKGFLYCVSLCLEWSSL